MIEISDVNKTYETGNKALRNINISIEEGEFVFIVGQSRLPVEIDSVKAAVKGSRAYFR